MAIYKEVKKNIQQIIRQNIVCKSDNQINRPMTFQNDVCYKNCQLPNTSKLSRQLKKKFDEKVIDDDMTDDLENINAINWSKSKLTLTVLAVSVPRDGNCLLHSVSMAIWGVDDESNILRELLYLTAANDTKGNFKRRWSRYYIHELSGFTKSSSEIIDKEWQDVINNVKNASARSISAAVPHQFLEAVHVYILANILRRPILVISGSFVCSINGHKLQDNSIDGVYLPLEWTPNECCKNPVILGYHLNHFCPLLSEIVSEVNKCLFPLVDKDLCFHPIRFLLEGEEHKAWELVQSYLIIKELEDSSTSFPCVQVTYNPPNINYFEIILKMCEEESVSIKGSPKIDNKFNSAVSENPSCTSNQVVSPSAPLMSGFQSDPPLSMLNERCRNNCGYRCSTQTYPFCHQCFGIELNKSQQMDLHTKPTAPSMSEFSSTESNSFEVIPLPSEESLNPSYTEITWQEGENIYILKTPDTPESSISQPSSHQVLENLMSKILSVNSDKKVEPNLGEVPGSKALSMQKEKEEKLFYPRKRSESPNILPSSAKPVSPNRMQYSRGQCCIVSGCPNYGDPAEEDMCSSCYRKKMLQTSFIPVQAENLMPLQSASYQTISQKPIHSSGNYTATGSSYYPSHSQTSQRPNIHMQESSTNFSESVPPSQIRITHNILFNEGRQTSPSELVTSVGSKLSHLARPGSEENNAVNNFNEIYERTVMKNRNEFKCQRSECTNYGNPSKHGYCNACFIKYKKKILEASYGEDVPD